jgi:His/Glu/Gln/Arg/opine family amino acid ABC transporter permease subunit
MVSGFVIAIVVAIVSILPGKSFGLKYFFQGYVDFFRSTPLVLQMLVAYLSLPQFLQTIGWTTFRIDGESSAILALALNSGAYQSEIIRAGILSIPSGQTEASRGLGFTQLQTFRYVILPQAFRLIIPPLTNEGINVILNSSLAYVLAVEELTRKSRDLSVKWFLSMQILSVAAVFYFIMAYSLAKVTKKMEKRLRIPGLGVQHG